MALDITARGDVGKVDVVTSTNHCFDNDAARNAERWVYLPKRIDGVFAPRLGVEAQVTFELNN